MSHTTDQMFHLSANLSFMFNELPWLQRYAAAARAGFRYCESGFPPVHQGVDLNRVVEEKNKSGIEQTLLNLYTGDTSKGELGVTGTPGKEETFKQHLNTTIDLAKKLKVQIIHVMSGRIDGSTCPVKQIETYKKNLSYASKRLNDAGMVGIIEPISKAAVPDYLMNDYNLATSILKELRAPNMKIMMDVFHCQQINGSITSTIDAVWPHIGYVQVAQVPHRHEPFLGSGEIDFTYVFRLLKDKKYEGYVGLEYKPERETVDGLSWIEKVGVKMNL